MNRREFVKILMLSAGSSVVRPAIAFMDVVSSSDEPLTPKPCATTGDKNEGTNTGFPRIGIVAAGSGACGVLAQLTKKSPYLSRTIAMDTSPLALYRTAADRYVWVGKDDEKASDPNTVRFQAKVIRSEIADSIEGLDLIWLLSSLGGAAGTGIAPIVADIAKELGVTAVAASITPFPFEGVRRRQIAHAGLNAVTRRVSASIELPNAVFAANADDELMSVVLGRAAKKFDELYQSISSALSQHGLVGVDLEDFRAAMARGRGTVAYGYGQDQTAVGAFNAAVNDVLLGTERLTAAKGIFIAMQGSPQNLNVSLLNEVMSSVNAYAPTALTMYSAVLSAKPQENVTASILVAV